MSENYKEKQIVLSKWKFKVNVVIIIILSFSLYNQWISKTNLYMSDRYSIWIDATLYQHNIQQYLDQDDIMFLYMAESYGKSISIQSRAFQLYYRNQMGNDLYYNITTIFHNFDLFAEDKDRLAQRVKNIEPLIGALISEDKWSFGGHISPPINPNNKNNTKEILLITENIIENES